MPGQKRKLESHDATGWGRLKGVNMRKSGGSEEQQDLASNKAPHLGFGGVGESAEVRGTHNIPIVSHIKPLLSIGIDICFPQECINRQRSNLDLGCT